MPQLHLSETDLSETLTRARQIAEQRPVPALAGPDCEALLAAGEEMGLPREAVLQALRERIPVTAEAFAAGETVFAPSVDGSWYPAAIVDLGSHSATVRFHNGGEHTCAQGDLRPLALVPGRKVQADWPGWGWCTVDVVKYEPKQEKLTLSDGWSKKTLSLRKVRLSPKLASPPTLEERRIAALTRSALVRCSLLAGSAGVGIGLLLGWLLRFL